MFKIKIALYFYFGFINTSSLNILKNVCRRVDLEILESKICLKYYIIPVDVQKFMMIIFTTRLP